MYVHGVLVMAFFGPHGTQPFDLIPTAFSAVRANQLGWSLVGLIASHGFSFFWNYVKNGEYQRASLNALMGQPYGRVIALHLTVLFGGWLVILLGSPLPALVVLVIIKPVADVRAPQPGGNDRARVHRQVLLGVGAALYRRANAGCVSGRGDRLARVSAALERHGEPAAETRRLLHGSRHSQPAFQPRHRDHRHRGSRAGRARDPDPEESEPRLRVERRTRPGARWGHRVGDRPVAGWTDRLCDQPSPRSRPTHRACAATDQRERRLRLGLRLDSGGGTDPWRSDRRLPL